MSHFVCKHLHSFIHGVLMMSLRCLVTWVAARSTCCEPSSPPLWNTTWQSVRIQTWTDWLWSGIWYLSVPVVAGRGGRRLFKALSLSPWVRPGPLSTGSLWRIKQMHHETTDMRTGSEGLKRNTHVSQAVAARGSKHAAVIVGEVCRVVGGV